MRSEEGQQNLRLHNSDFIVRKVQSSKIHFYTVEESTKEIFIGTKILAAEFSVLSILRWPLQISSHFVSFSSRLENRETDTSLCRAVLLITAINRFIRLASETAPLWWGSRGCKSPTKRHSSWKTSLDVAQGKVSNTMVHLNIFQLIQVEWQNFRDQKTSWKITVCPE